MYGYTEHSSDGGRVVGTDSHRAAEDVRHNLSVHEINNQRVVEPLQRK